MMGRCAKKVIKCFILDRDGVVGFGANDCMNPQDECPREEGEGYEKCVDICEQRGHAEEMAIRDAINSGRLKGATAIVCGVNRICNECADKLTKVGVMNRIIMP
jgi:deoxycytidylate deaminase